MDNPKNDSLVPAYNNLWIEQTNNGKIIIGTLPSGIKDYWVVQEEPAPKIADLYKEMFLPPLPPQAVASGPSLESPPPTGREDISWT